MLRRFLVLSVGALALLVVLGAPGQLHAQHFRGGTPHMAHPGFHGRFDPRFHRGFFDPRFHHRFFDPRFERRFFDPGFHRGFFFFDPRFNPGFFVPF